jgi:hypothetical protein
MAGGSFMPLVFIHGVATRQSPGHRAQVHQRDALFKQLVLPGDTEVFDPDWGSDGVKFDPTLPWMPEPGGVQAFGTRQAGPVGTAQVGIGRLATLNPGRAIDVAFEAGLAKQVDTATRTGNPAEALTTKELEVFEAAVRYLEAGADKTAFDPLGSDAEFISALALELKLHVPNKGPAAEPMGPISDALQWLSQGLKDLVRPIRNTTSDAVLRVVRRPLTEQVAFILGDVFVYLRGRETGGVTGTANRIFAPIMADLVKAARLRSPADPLILVCHSLGAVILYDLLSDRAAVAKIETDSGFDLNIDAWITVGAQPGLFADMGLYGTVPGTTADGRLPRPAPVRVWLNVYDYTDVLAFTCKKIFNDVEDFEFGNITGLFSAHTSYFQRPSFYQRLRARLNELRQHS